MTLDLLSLARSREVNRLTLFVDACRELDADEIAESFRQLSAIAPRRADRGKRYLVGHSGIPSSSVQTNRMEEHLAIALVHHGRLDFGTGSVAFIDYQVPLKARMGDVGIGKIDILGCDDTGRLVVVELKILSQGGSPETPLRAWLEALAYAAILGANHDTMVTELVGTSHVLTDRVPKVCVAAPTNYWARIDERVHDWREPFQNLVDAVEQRLGVTTLLVDLGMVTVEPGLDGSRPQLNGMLAPQVVAMGDPHDN